MKLFLSVGRDLKSCYLQARIMGMRHGELLVFFYDGLFSNVRQFVEMMCNGEFMNKSPDEACDYFDLLAGNAQVWETTNTSER